MHYSPLPKKLFPCGESKIVLLPVPFDKTASWLKGSAQGPKALLEASHFMEVYDIETDSSVYEKGIFTAEEVKAETSGEMVEKVYEKCKEFLSDEKFVVVLGGEHTVAVGAIKAHAEKFENMSILHLDAHMDLRDSFQGSKLSHGCVIARAKEFVENIVSAGIRSMSAEEKEKLVKGKVFFAREILNSSGWMEKVLSELSENVYVSLDFDVFDPAVFPSTGTPEPGGLDWYQVTGLLRKVAEKKNLVGADFTELLPMQAKAPDFTAALLVYKLLSYKFK